MIPDRFPTTLIDRISYLLRRYVETQTINCVMSLAGRIDASRLRRAVRLAMDAEPIVGCRFVPHWYQPYWQRRADLDALPLCEVAEDDGCGPALASVLVQSLDPACDPLLKAVVLRGATDTVCLKCSHTVGDGQSAIRLTLLVAELYRRLIDEPHYTPTPNLAGVRHLRELTQQLGLVERFRFVRRAAAGFSVPDETWLFPERHASGPFRAYALLKLPPDRVTALFRYGRRRQASVTCVLLAALYLAARDLFQPALADEVTFGATADLRQYLPLGHRQTAVSNMSGPLRFRLDPRREEDFDPLLERIRAQLRQVLNDPALVASRMSVLIAFPFLAEILLRVPFSLLAARVGRHVARLAARPGRRWTLANLGAIEPEQVDLGHVAVEDLYFTGGISTGPGIQVAASLYRQGLTISVGISERVMDESTARAFLEQFDRRLPAHAEMPGSVRVLTAQVLNN